MRCRGLGYWTIWMAAGLLVTLTPSVVRAQTAASGVAIDADGVLRTKVFDDPGGQLMRERIASAKATLDPKLASYSKLRKVSLNRLEQVILGRQGVLTDEMRYLAGLLRVRFVRLRATRLRATRTDFRRFGEADFRRRLRAAFCALVPKNLICFAVRRRRELRLRFAFARRLRGFTTRLTLTTVAIRVLLSRSGKQRGGELNPGWGTESAASCARLLPGAASPLGSYPRGRNLKYRYKDPCGLSRLLPANPQCPRA